MTEKVYIRPLESSDALTSYKWRNDSEVWQFTGARPDKTITPEIEQEWIARVIQNPNEKRFAICIKGTGQYVGNIQLTNIKNGSAQYHIFIGEKSFWGKGLAKEASLQLLDYAFSQLNLNRIILEVNTDNISAVNLYRKIGFQEQNIPASQPNFIVMTITSADFNRQTQQASC